MSGCWVLASVTTCETWTPQSPLGFVFSTPEWNITDSLLPLYYTHFICAVFICDFYQCSCSSQALSPILISLSLLPEQPVEYLENMYTCQEEVNSGENRGPPSARS